MPTEDIDRITARQRLAAKYIVLVIASALGYGLMGVFLEAAGCGGLGQCGEGVYFPPESIPFIPISIGLWAGTLALVISRDLWRRFGAKREFIVTLPPE